jgi:hypothetical protein
MEVRPEVDRIKRRNKNMENNGLFDNSNSFFAINFRLRSRLLFAFGSEILSMVDKRKKESSTQSLWENKESFDRERENGRSVDINRILNAIDTNKRDNLKKAPILFVYLNMKCINSSEEIDDMRREYAWE